MQYIIVAGNKSERIRTSVRECFFVSPDLSKAISRFAQINNERRFKHTYLIADFEQHTKSESKQVLRYEEDADFLPYLIIGEYHHDYIDPDYAIRADKLIISKMGGACFEFDNNLNALRMYLGMLKHDPQLKLDIEYLVDRFGKTGIKKQTISIFFDTKEDHCYPLSRFEIESNSWEPAPMQTSQLQIYDISKDDIFRKTSNILLNDLDSKKEIELFPE